VLGQGWMRPPGARRSHYFVPSKRGGAAGVHSLCGKCMRKAALLGWRRAMRNLGILVDERGRITACPYRQPGPSW
jgi:hypothetical protein